MIKLLIKWMLKLNICSKMVLMLLYLEVLTNKKIKSIFKLMMKIWSVFKELLLELVIDTQIF